MNSDMPSPSGLSSKMSSDANNKEAAVSKALLRNLHFHGVKFIRYMTVDLCNNIRCKVKPVKQLLLSSSSEDSLFDFQVSVAEINCGGLPNYADVMVPGTGLTAQNFVILQPDLASLRNLPYVPHSAVLMTNLLQMNNNNDDQQHQHEPSPYCTRSLLQKVLHQAKEQHNIAFSVGVELEFYLVDAKTGNFIDDSVFANTTTLNEQEEFLSDLYDQLEQQYIPIELIHAESGPGQLEVVLQYSQNPLELIDHVVLAQETIRAVAAKKKYGYKASFLPKYNSTKAGNGLHIHLSIRDATTGVPLMAATNDGTAASSPLSLQASAFVEGMLQHLPGLLGLTMPTVNSFRRIGPGCWTGSQVGWAFEDKEAAIRLCADLRNTRQWTHVEYKLCDCSCNLYLALAAILSSGLHGMEEKRTLRPALGHEATDQQQQQPAPPLPTSAIEALNALQDDNFLINVLGSQMMHSYLTLRQNEIDHNQSL